MLSKTTAKPGASTCRYLKSALTAIVVRAAISIGCATSQFKTCLLSARRINPNKKLRPRNSIN